MKVNHAFEITDDDARRVRARDGRGGKATRKELRAFISLAVRVAVDALPPAKRRAPKAKAVERTTFAPPDDSPEGVKKTRDKIARLYGHKTTDETETPFNQN